MGSDGAVEATVPPVPMARGGLGLVPVGTRTALAEAPVPVGTGTGAVLADVGQPVLRGFTATAVPVPMDVPVGWATGTSRSRRTTFAGGSPIVEKVLVRRMCSSKYCGRLTPAGGQAPIVRRRRGNRSRSRGHEAQKEQRHNGDLHGVLFAVDCTWAVKMSTWLTTKIESTRNGKRTIKLYTQNTRGVLRRIPLSSCGIYEETSVATLTESFGIQPGNL